MDRDFSAVERLKFNAKARIRLAIAKVQAAFKSEEAQADARSAIFDGIYTSGKWGGEASGGFYSGAGSRGDAAEQYCVEMGARLKAMQDALGRPLRVVDIGCGDFHIGQQLLSTVPDFHYTGCDIAKSVIGKHSEDHASERAAFQYLDIVTMPPPPADVILIRQVFQHLSNAEILDALSNLPVKTRIFVTEGQPEHPEGPLNPDKAAGSAIRFHWASGTGRGVELDKPPFSRRTEKRFSFKVPPHEIVVTEELFL